MEDENASVSLDKGPQTEAEEGGGEEEFSPIDKKVSFSQAQDQTESKPEIEPTPEKKDENPLAELDEKLFRRCRLEDCEDDGGEKFERMPCQDKFKLRPEDEISVDSIISALLSFVEPTDKEIQESCKWGIKTKDLHNEKQAILCDEKLYISHLKDTNCKLTEENKIFLESELEMVGEFVLKIEESYDGYVVLSRSHIKKPKDKSECGHTVKGKYDDRFLLIVEKRMEYDHIDKVRIEKTLEVRNPDDRFIHAMRATKISSSEQRFKTKINIKNRDCVFILDGGVLLFMRYLVVNNFRGRRDYYTMNLAGKILRCTLCIREQRKRVRIFYKTFENTICVVNKQYFNDVVQDQSETYYLKDGQMVLHYWHGYNYIIHAVRKPEKPKEHIVPKLELMWRSDKVLFKQYKEYKEICFRQTQEYLSEHPELVDFVHDYLSSLLKFKPEDVVRFTVTYFQNMKSRFPN